MIHLYSTPGARTQAEALRETLGAAYPDLRLEALAPGAQDLTTDPMWPRWDDLLVLVFADDPLPDALHGLIREEIQTSRDRGRACRIVPVHTLADQSMPPEPLDLVKSIRGVDPRGPDGQAIVRRVGALLGLWLRGDDRKVFVSHRQVDGKAIAADADKVEETFKSAGFDWTILDGERQLYTATKPDEGAALTRLLSHCSAVSPRFFHAVHALQEYRQNDAGHAGSRPARGINLFNNRLFVYEPPLPRPELTRLARDYGFDQDPILRLIDPGRLATFLKRFQADT